MPRSPRTDSGSSLKMKKIACSSGSDVLLCFPRSPRTARKFLAFFPFWGTHDSPHDKQHKVSLIPRNQRPARRHYYKLLLVGEKCCPPKGALSSSMPKQGMVFRLPRWAGRKNVKRSVTTQLCTQDLPSFVRSPAILSMLNCCLFGAHAPQPELSEFLPATMHYSRRRGGNMSSRYSGKPRAFKKNRAAAQSARPLSQTSGRVRALGQTLQKKEKLQNKKSGLVIVSAFDSVGHPSGWCQIVCKSDFSRSYVNP